MTNSWKIGAISGLIAGLVFGIVESIFGLPIYLSLGFAETYAYLYDLPFQRIVVNFIIVNLIMGTILGVIYSKANRVIPGKPVIKGLIFSLVGILLFNVYFAIIFIPYAPAHPQIVELFLFSNLVGWISYGLVLGYLYDFLKHHFQIPDGPDIVTYDMKSGILPGAIAGVIAGAGGSFFIILLVYFGLWPIYPRELIDVYYVISQIGTQILIHLIPGVYIGAIYPRVYNLVTGKGVRKGLYYGLIATFVFTELRAMFVDLVAGNYIGAVNWIVAGLSMAIIFGLVLGLLYRKPSE